MCVRVLAEFRCHKSRQRTAIGGTALTGMRSKQKQSRSTFIVSPETVVETTGNVRLLQVFA